MTTRGPSARARIAALTATAPRRLAPRVAGVRSTWGRRAHRQPGCVAVALFVVAGFIRPPLPYPCGRPTTPHSARIVSPCPPTSEMGPLDRIVPFCPSRSCSALRTWHCAFAAGPSVERMGNGLRQVAPRTTPGCHQDRTGMRLGCHWSAFPAAFRTAPRPPVPRGVPKFHVESPNSTWSPQIPRGMGGGRAEQPTDRSSAQAELQAVGLRADRRFHVECLRLARCAA